MGIKVLGQSAPSATTETALYTVPASTKTVTGNLIACNRSSAGIFYRVSVSAGGGATATKDYLMYESLVPAYESLSLLTGLTLAATDVVRVYASTANASFSLMGEEQDDSVYTKILGQVSPDAITETPLYSVPAGKFAVSSSLFACNQGTVSATFRISISVGGGATANQDYLFYDVALAPYETLTAMMGLTLAAGDAVRVYASAANVSFNLMGEERPA